MGPSYVARRVDDLSNKLGMQQEKTPGRPVSVDLEAAECYKAIRNQIRASLKRSIPEGRPAQFTTDIIVRRRPHAPYPPARTCIAHPILFIHTDLYGVFWIHWLCPLVHDRVHHHGQPRQRMPTADQGWDVHRIRRGVDVRHEPGAKRKTPGEHNAEKQQTSTAAGQFTIRWELVKLRLLQIYWGNGIVYIIDLPAMKEVPHELERVCASSAIIKAGTGLFCDASRLWKDFRMNLLSCVELGLAFKLVYPETTRPRAFYSELVGLADVAEHVCGMKLDKSQRETDWSKSVLSSEQLQYAATDAYTSFECYTRLQSEIDRCEYDIPSALFMVDVVGNTRVQAGTREVEG
ncbi:ribonuclease H-like domain-containing protein [Mycena olivaceomarginata]|nr:ribonuclease H-like domain-containing protein [Mycena olivaceomarginata]